jgi:hypothetical protein
MLIYPNQNFLPAPLSEYSPASSFGFRRPFVEHDSFERRYSQRAKPSYAGALFVTLKLTDDPQYAISINVASEHD